MTKGWDSGRYHDHRTVDEIRFLEGLGGHALQRGAAPERIRRLLAGYRAAMTLRWEWGNMDPRRIRKYLKGVKNGK